MTAETIKQEAKLIADSRAKSSAEGFLYPLFILLVGLLCYIPWLGSYGLLDPTDSFFLESGRELLETKQYLLPLNNYVPWLDKPILFFWMVASAFKLFGVSPFVGRLPAALSAIAAGLIIYAGSRPILKRQHATLAALIFMTLPLTSIIGHVCLTDMTLCALITGSILFLFKGLQFVRQKDILLGYLFLGLAMLCKGPISIIICALAIFPYLISVSSSRTEFFNKLLKLRPLLGAAIVLLINLPWYIMASIATNGQFLVAFFITQNFGRMVGTVNHQGPFYFYVPVFFGGFVPWWILLGAAPGIFKKTLQNRTAEKSTFRRFLRLNLFWFLGVMILFSIIKTKLPTYILPAVPAFSILVAMQAALSLRFKKTKVLAVTTAVLSVALCAGAIVIPFLKGYVRDIAMQNIWMAVPLILCLFCSWFGVLRQKHKLAILSIVAFSFLISAVIVPRGLRSFYVARQVGFSDLVIRARDAGASVSMIFAEEPSVPWITHKPVSRLNSPEDAVNYLKKTPKPHHVLVQTAGLSRLSWFAAPSRQIKESGKWHLYEVDD